MNTSTQWPSAVISQAQQHNLVLVVGAGISAESTNGNGAKPPTWANLLNSLARQIMMSECLDNFDALINQNRLLDAAELLRFDAAERSRTQDLYTAIKEAVDGPKNHLFRGNRWHDAMMAMEPSIIVTTNFDKIIERTTMGGFQVHRYTSTQIAADIRRNYPTLIKIHGCLDQVEEIVLSRHDYTLARQRGVHAFDTLHALFLTRPVLFLGYSLDDPDLQLILENVRGGREEVPPHYILISDDIHSYRKRVFRDSYGVVPICYPAGNYDEAFERFKELSDIVTNTPPMGQFNS